MLVLSLILSGSLVLVSDCVLIVLGGVSAREHLACGRDLTIVPFSPALVFLFSEEGRRIDRKCRVGRVIECVLSWVATQWSWTMQQASRASQGFSPGQPLYRMPQYLPYRRNGAAVDRVAEDHVGRLISERSMQLRGNKPCRSWKRRVNCTYSCSGPTRTCGCTPAACSARESKSTVNRGVELD